MDETGRPFRVALSYPGEFRALIERVAEILAARLGRRRVFFDKWHEASIQGADADLKLLKIYAEQSDLVVGFVSEHTQRKAWTNHEWRIIRNLRHEGADNVLLVTLDGTRPEGVLGIDVIVDGRDRDAEYLASCVFGRLGVPEAAEPAAPPATGYYRVGCVEAHTQVDLLGGGDEVFDRRSIRFEYQHVWAPLHPLVEEHKQEWLKEALAEADERGTQRFNGPCVRLHSFQPGIGQAADGAERKAPVLSLRPTRWFDHICSNRRMDKEFTVSPGRFTTLRAACADEERVATRRIEEIALSNILTVSVVLVTPDGWTIVARARGRWTTRRACCRPRRPRTCTGGWTSRAIRPIPGRPRTIWWLRDRVRRWDPTTGHGAHPIPSIRPCAGCGRRSARRRAKAPAWTTSRSSRSPGTGQPSTRTCSRSSARGSPATTFGASSPAHGPRTRGKSCPGS